MYNYSILYKEVKVIFYHFFLEKILERREGCVCVGKIGQGNTRG